MKLFTKKCTSNKTNTCLYKKYTEKNINKKHIKEHKMNEIKKRLENVAVAQETKIC